MNDRGQRSGGSRNNNRRRRGGGRRHAGAGRHSSQRRQQHQRGGQRRRSKSLGPAAILKKLFHLQNQHNLARKKYYEFFYRATPRQKEKLERLFYQTLEMLRNFEARLKPWQKELVDKNYCTYPQEATYCQNHGLTQEAYQEEYLQNKADIPDENPHLLESQLGRPQYADDTEESSGTLEDYYAVKGIDSPID